MSEYRIEWKRDTETESPEDIVDTDMREDAVMQMLHSAGADTDAIEYEHPPRRLGGDLGPYYHICQIVVSNIPTFIYLYEYLTNDENNEVTVSDGEDELTEEDIDELREEIKAQSDE